MFRFKRLTALTVALVMALTMLPAISVFAATANPTASTVLVDGKDVAFDAYNINENNYYRSVYRKLGINSKGELFMYFGTELAAETISETTPDVPQ